MVTNEWPITDDCRWLMNSRKRKNRLGMEDECIVLDEWIADEEWIAGNEWIAGHEWKGDKWIVVYESIAG